mmetsp:Transcript_31340/g.73799  ORF Transcript_31340/g.73799 Transcript_31340/m.73799 type:complete len:214 (-) Transcript_31340:867-1508(-)
MMGRWPSNTALGGYGSRLLLLLLLLHDRHHSGLHHRLLLWCHSARHGVIAHHRICVMMLLLHCRNHRVKVRRWGHTVLSELPADELSRWSSVLSRMVVWVVRCVGVVRMVVWMVRGGRWIRRWMMVVGMVLLRVRVCLWCLRLLLRYMVVCVVRVLPYCCRCGTGLGQGRLGRGRIGGLGTAPGTKGVADLVKGDLLRNLRPPSRVGVLVVPS